MIKTIILCSLIIMALIIPCILLYNTNDNQNYIKNIYIYATEHNNKYNSIKNAPTIKMGINTTLKKYESKFMQFMDWIESDLDSTLALIHSLSTAYMI